MNKISKNKKRIPILEKRLLWNIEPKVKTLYAIAPITTEKILEKHKNKIIETQILEMLGELSSNLIGGISIHDTLSKGMEKIKAPLKNHISLYLMLSKKHGSIKACSTCINKSKNIFLKMFFIMILNHVKNGGAIAEHIKNLQKVLFLRTNIKQRINAQLLQTKIQVIAGTILPYFVFFIMNILYHDMIQNVFVSGLGIFILSIAVVLHSIGVIVFIRICRFDMSLDMNSSMFFEYISFSLKNGVGLMQSINEACNAGLGNMELRLAVQKSSSTKDLIELISKTKYQYRDYLCSILNKAYSLGLSINKELSEQASNILEILEQRSIRFQQSAPAKALIPMLFCIFPATYLMILTPVIVQVLK